MTTIIIGACFIYATLLLFALAMSKQADETAEMIHYRLERLALWESAYIHAELDLGREPTVSELVAYRDLLD